MAPPRVSVNIIRAYEGPRHARLEAIWRAFAVRHQDRMTLHIFDNRGPVLTHANALQAMWRNEFARPEPVAIFTEFDFLPTDDFFAGPEDDLGRPVVTAEHCMRDPYTRRLLPTGVPGPWYVRVDKVALGLADLDFRPGGPNNDPAGRLSPGLVSMIAVDPERDDCRPTHYGVRVGARGVHLFGSRYYSDDPRIRVHGLALGDVLAGVDKALDEYEAAGEARAR